MARQHETFHRSECSKQGALLQAKGFDPAESLGHKDVRLMRILFTGISSFTGYWFAKALASAGHQIVAPLSGSLQRYQTVRRSRIEQLQSVCRLAPDAPFGSEAFLNLIRESGPWDLMCHHAAEAANYRSPDFDVHRALLSNTLNLQAVLAALQGAAGKGIVLTGTVFENDEGAGNDPLRAFSPYGLSKGLTWQVFRFYCERAGLGLGKFVIPNPFGPWEEPRFTAYLMNTWKQRLVAAVKTPDYVRDNIHVDLLASVYLRFTEQVAGGQARKIKINPSGYAESQAAFASRVAREVQTRLGWPCGLEFLAQEDFSEPLARTNLEPAAPLVPEWNERAAWDKFVEFYAQPTSAQ